MTVVGPKMAMLILEKLSNIGLKALNNPSQKALLALNSLK